MARADFQKFSLGVLDRLANTGFLFGFLNIVNLQKMAPCQSLARAPFFVCLKETDRFVDQSGRQGQQRVRQQRQHKEASSLQLHFNDRIILQRGLGFNTLPVDPAIAIRADRNAG